MRAGGEEAPEPVTGDGHRLDRAEGGDAGAARAPVDGGEVADDLAGAPEGEDEPRTALGADGDDGPSGEQREDEGAGVAFADHHLPGFVDAPGALGEQGPPVGRREGMEEGAVLAEETHRPLTPVPSSGPPGKTAHRCPTGAFACLFSPHVAHWVPQLTLCHVAG